MTLFLAACTVLAGLFSGLLSLWAITDWRDLTRAEREGAVIFLVGIWIIFAALAVATRLLS
jgi:hypothetical protein